MTIIGAIIVLSAVFGFGFGTGQTVPKIQIQKDQVKEISWE